MDRETRAPDREGAALTQPADGGALGFAWRSRKSGDVEILRDGRVVTTLRGVKAREFVDAMRGATATAAQQLMARATGNYRRGNERTAARHPRNARD